MRSRRQTLHSLGMTMVEILITMVLVVLIFSSIFQLVQISHRRTLRGGDLTIATIYAADVLELVRGGPYEAFFKDGQTPEKDLDLKTVFSRSSFFKGYDPGKYDSRFDIRVAIGPAGEMPPSKLKQVSVTVTWKERLTGRIPHPVKMVTFYSPSNL